MKGQGTGMVPARIIATATAVPPFILRQAEVAAHQLAHIAGDALPLLGGAPFDGLDQLDRKHHR